MINRVTIYGDSFAEPQWEHSHPTWYGRLKDRWPETVNHGKSGAGPMYSFKQFYQDISGFNYEDLIVFIMSGAPRIHFEFEEVLRRSKFDPSSDIGKDVHMWSNRVMLDITGDTHNPFDSFQSEDDYKEWISLNKDKARFAVDTFRDETVYGNWKYESLLYTVSRIQKCKIFVWYLTLNESYVKTSLNDEYFYIHDEALEKACMDEYINFNEDIEDAYYRVNHMSEVNHEVMYKQVTGFVDGREMPRFLKNVYKGTYTNEFIYD